MCDGDCCTVCVSRHSALAKKNGTAHVDDWSAKAIPTKSTRKREHFPSVNMINNSENDLSIVDKIL